MIRYGFAGALTLMAIGCGAARERPEPPSGAVDPGIHGLATPGDAARAAPRPAEGGAGSPGSLPGALPGGLPGAPPGGLPGAAAPRASAPPTGEATGKITMTREHCETLGRKFAELTMAQAPGAGAEMKAEADNVGRTFADRCAHDMAGQTVEAGEYQCMLRARAAEELLSCKR
ncbi:MAG: hypothetical protein QM820_41750 [Minicystis sp.]